MTTKPLQQTIQWKEFQESLGHEMYQLQHQLLRVQPLFFGKSYAYLPCGPHLNDKSSQIFANSLKKLAQKHHFIFTRVDNLENLNDYFQIVSSHSPYPESTLILDITQSEQDLLSQMKRKGRYNISLAQKKGVIVKRASTKQQKKEYAQHFYNLLQQTTLRDGFFAHNLDYYQKMLGKLSMAEIFIAYFQDIPISGAICTYYNSIATYYYGASSNQFRELMSPYLIQWEAIRYGKKKNCHSYDFLGIAPENSNTNHPWQGITSFKKKFGGKVISSSPATDLIHQKGWYRLYQLLKFLQKYWLKLKKISK